MRSGHERARTVAEAVAAQIRDVAPEGLGRWAPVCHFVAPASDRFMEKMASTDSRFDLDVAGITLVRSWAEAAGQWRKAGSPVLDRHSDAIEADAGEFVSS